VIKSGINCLEFNLELREIDSRERHGVSTCSWA
jgi:hypothetical protein